MLTYEEKRDFLKRYGDFVGIAKEVKQQIMDLRETQLPASPNLDGMPKNPHHEDRMAKYAVRHMELVKKYDNAMACVYEIHKGINSVEDTREQLVLGLSFIQGLKTWEIADEMNYSERMIQMIRKSGTDHIRLDEVIVDAAKHTRVTNATSTSFEG